MALRPLFPSLNLFAPSFQLKIPTWRVPLPLLTLSSLAAPFLNRIPNPSSILQDIWDGILRAVPKKKTSYSKSRMRRLAGKGLKDVMSIVKCPSCGRPKRSHFLCPYCVYGKSTWNGLIFMKLMIIATQLFWKNAWKDLGVKMSGKDVGVKTSETKFASKEEAKS
jgi:large subunit ribosomal protein L32